MAQSPGPAIGLDCSVGFEGLRAAAAPASGSAGRETGRVRCCKGRRGSDLEGRVRLHTAGATKPIRPLHSAFYASRSPAFGRRRARAAATGAADGFNALMADMKAARQRTYKRIAATRLNAKRGSIAVGRNTLTRPNHAPRFRHRLPRLQLRPRRQGRAREGHRLSGQDGLARRRLRTGLRHDRAARRLLLRRLPALWRHGGTLADHARRRCQGESRHARARHLQRLPGAVRVGPAAGRADAQRLAEVHLPRRAPEVRAGRHVLHPVLPQGRTDPPPRRPRRGQLLRGRGARSTASKARAASPSATATPTAPYRPKRTSTAPSATSPASPTRPAASSA